MPAIGPAETDIPTVLHRRLSDVPRDRLIEIGMLQIFARTHLMDAWSVPVVCLLVFAISLLWTPWQASAAWFALTMVAVAVADRLYRRFLAAAATLEDPAPWRRRLLAGRMAVIVAWSAMALFAWPGDYVPGQFFLLLMLSCAMALRTASSAAFAEAMRLQLLPPLFGMLAVCAAQFDLEFAGLALAGVFYAGFLLRFGNLSARRVREMFKLQFDLLDAKEAADQANRAKTAYLATISHEIRTPMTGMLGLTRLLLETQLSPRQREYARTMHDSGEALLSILNDVLDLSKVEAGRMDIEAVDFDPRRLVQGVASLMEGRAAEKDLTLESHVAEAVPARLTGDPLRLRQVLVNLVGNAIKFTESGGVRIAVEVEPLPHGCVTLGVVVSDTGIGIPEEARDRLFETFAQADSGISRRFGGSGLGLAISQKLIRAMGGEIGFRSSPGAGSDFWFTVPLPVAEQVPEAAAAAPLAEVPSLAILVAEDVTANQMVLEAFLRSRGHRVTLVSDGRAAVRAVAEGRFDLVLMDMQMARLDGIAATRAIRALPDSDRAGVPIIATTANATSADASLCRQAGMNGFVAKPILPEKLFDEIKAVWTGSGRAVHDPQPAQPMDAAHLFDTTGLDGLVEAMTAEELVEFVRLSADTLMEAAEAAVQAVAAGRTADARAAVHRLRGTAANVGLKHLAECARKAEPVAASGRSGAADPLLACLPDAAREGAAILEAWLLQTLERTGAAAVA
ncbi:MAG TPA: ATP-binding protein [Azospirillaceae bacterium]|nr:ATP-binding protein [Azospirillaceae bacterium]